MNETQKQSWWLRISPFASLQRRRLRRERIALARQHQGTGLLHDPIEDDPHFQPMLEEAHALAEAEEPPRGLGSCHRLWAAKKRILKTQFNIEWFSRADMNPGIRFD